MNDDFQDLLRELCDVEARFLIVGAYALAAHGKPRATGDIDVWVDPTPENAQRVYAALQAFGAPLHELSIADLQTPNIVFQMGLPPRRIDILTQISGVDFGDAWPNRIMVAFGQVTVPVLGAEDFIRNKRETGRPKDIVDADDLRELLHKKSGGD
ncbi:MAG: hypothetical protein H0U74_08200 [Bradymonadaceae bacterium]|nr:hypothetical protein [Lujinxingiaceae bacterium]